MVGQARAHARLDAGHGTEQGARIRMLRVVEDGVHGSLLHHAAQVHDGDLVAHLGDHAQVVGDQDDGHAFAPLEIGEEGEDLRLGRHVEGGGRLVRDEDARAARQGEGDHGPLAQTTR